MLRLAMAKIDAQLPSSLSVCRRTRIRQMVCLLVDGKDVATYRQMVSGKKAIEDPRLMRLKIAKKQFRPGSVGHMVVYTAMQMAKT